MNSFDLLKPFNLSYKHQLMFLNEREKLFLSKENQEKSITLSTPDDSLVLVIDEKEDEQHEDENDTTQSSVNSSIITTKLTTQDTPNEVPFPEEYLLPVLPNQVNDAISLKQMDKFEKLCNFRSIVIDAVFHDLKNKYNLLYPTRAQYTSIVNGILNHLNIELETKKVNSWRESLISKYKRERQNSNDERRVEMKLKYSRETSGRKIKQRPITEMSERNTVNKILLVENMSSNNEQMAAKSETIKEDFQNSSSDHENLKQLWLETYEYRQSFINQNSIANVMEQFPAYSNPLMVLTDVKILKGIDLDISVKEKLDLLADKICSGSQYITDSSSIRCFKVLCGILNDSWKHYIYFHPEKPATPQPSIVVEDDGIKVYLDWTYVCSSSSIEQSLGIIVSLYCIMNLKFHAHRTAIRFLYVYFLNEKQHQSNCIRKFCKEYNIELQDKSSSSPIHRLEEIENTDPQLNKEIEQNDENLIIQNKQDSPEEIPHVFQIMQAEPMSTDPQVSHKRKADQLADEQSSDNENAPPTKKTTRPTKTSTQPARPTKTSTQPTRPTRSTRSTSRKS